MSARQSTLTEKSDSPLFHSSPRISFYASQSCLAQDGGEAEPLSFSLDDTFRGMDELQDDPALFLDDGGWETAAAELSDSTLTLLNQDRYDDSLQDLYDMSYSFLDSVFSGYQEDELLQHLEGAREASKRTSMHWAHRRVCFLLGRLCARKRKYSQARVYFEEALGVPVSGFADVPLLVALYTGLTAIYLKQRLLGKLGGTLERACALLLGRPGHRFVCADELEVLALALRRAVVESDRHLEARACYLALRLLLRMRKVEDALPFVERLQFLCIGLAEEAGRPLAPVDLNWTLSRLYHRKYLPYLSLASLSLDSAPDRALEDAFQKIEVFVKGAVRLNPQWREGTSLIPAQILVYLQQALAIADRRGDLQTQRQLCMSLASVYQMHGALGRAVECARRAGRAGARGGGASEEEEGFEAAVLLAWLLVLTGEAEPAAATLEPLLQSLRETDSPAQRGVVYSLLGLCLRRQGRVREAGGHLYTALRIAREHGNRRNEALALANLGCLALSVRAPALAERFLLRALPLFHRLAHTPTDAEHAQTLLWLGRSYRDRGRSQDVRLAYETALLIAMAARNLCSESSLHGLLSRRRL